MAEGRPVFHLLAGPNGAGKTSFYNFWVRRRITDAEFVNADLLCLAALGRHAVSREDAQIGQRLAEARRDELMSQGRSLVAETTFSHPSKLELVQRAKGLGYEVVVYHLNLASADEAVARVAAREAQGGHPVPEANIRGRYQRNQALIREAALIADHAFVFDNTAFGRSPRLLVEFVNGRLVEAVTDLPAWAATLYGPDL